MLFFSNLNVDVTAKTLILTWLAIGDSCTEIRKAIGSHYVSAPSYSTLPRIQLTGPQSPRTQIPTGKKPEIDRVCRSLLGRGLAGAKTTVVTIGKLHLSACVTWAVEQLGEGGMGGP